MNSYHTKATKANPLLTYGEDWLSISHALSPPILATVCDEGDDGEYRSIFTAIILTTSPNVNALFLVITHLSVDAFDSHIPSLF